LLCWQPIEYRLDVYISIDVDFRLWIPWPISDYATLHFSLGASLRIEGPPFGGTARIEHRLFTIAIDFGERKLGVAPSLDWSTFAREMLPASPLTVRMRGASQTGEGRDALWIVQPGDDWEILVDCAVPAKAWRFQATLQDDRLGGLTSAQTFGKASGASLIGIQPMGVAPADFRSELNIDLTGPRDWRPTTGAGLGGPEALHTLFLAKPVESAAPPAIWGAKPPEVADPDADPRLSGSEGPKVQGVSSFSLRPAVRQADPDERVAQPAPAALEPRLAKAQPTSIPSFYPDPPNGHDTDRHRRQLRKAPA
jgi:hypothetical protein